MLYYLRIWLAGARYSIVRTLMFRGDFLIWSLVELLWMGVNLLLISVIYQHTASVAGWNEYEMILLIGTPSMLVQRLLMGFFWSSLFEMGQNIRTGAFDFFLAQPGHPLFMASVRKLDPDGLINFFVALGVVIFAARHLHLHPSILDMAAYAALILAGLAIHYSILVLSMSLAFWMASAQGIEGSYFTLVDFARLPREALRGIARVVFVWILPVVVVSNAPARTLLHGFQPKWAVWLLLLAAAWLALAVFVFNRGARRYSSASCVSPEDLPGRLGYTFRDPGLLRDALTHPSYLQDHPGAVATNQRLEFLGDAVLQLILTHRLFELYPGEREGGLSKRRSALSRGAFLAQLALETGLDACLLLGTSEESSGGRSKGAALEDAFEALVGALYLDSDFATAERVVLSLYGDLSARLAAVEGIENPKGRLQELIQPVHGNDALRYDVVGVAGADHARDFEVEVFLHQSPLGRGRGSSKKLAEEAAARAALETLE